MGVRLSVRPQSLQTKWAFLGLFLAFLDLFSLLYSRTSFISTPCFILRYMYHRQHDLFNFKMGGRRFHSNYTLSEHLNFTL